MLKLSDIRYEDALALLVLRKEALDSGAIPRMTKQAMSQTHLLTNIGLNFKKKALDSNIQNALIGAGVGAGVGGLGNLAFGNRSKSKLQRLVSGGATGLGLGGGLGLLYNSGNNVAKDLSKEKQVQDLPTTRLDEPTAKQINTVIQDSITPVESKQKLLKLVDSYENSGISPVRSLQGGLLGTGLVHGVGRVGNAIQLGKKPEEVTQDLTNRFMQKLINKDHKVDPTEFSNLRGFLDTTKKSNPPVMGKWPNTELNFKDLQRAHARSLVRPSGVEADLTNSPAKLVSEAIRTRLTPAGLRNKEIQNAISGVLTTDKKTPYSLTRPALRRFGPVGHSVGFAGGVIGSTALDAATSISREKELRKRLAALHESIASRPSGPRIQAPLEPEHSLRMNPTKTTP